MEILNSFIRSEIILFNFDPMQEYLNTLSKLFLFSTLLVLISFCAAPEKQAEQTSEPMAEESPAETQEKTILFFGNSLTAGYGIDADDSFAGLTQKRIDSLGLDYRVINGGLSGETTAGGLSRLDWFLEDQPDIFILELGGNDGLRGIEIAETKRNLLGIIEKVSSKYPETEIILAGMQIPPNMGQEYASGFTEIYPSVAEETNVTLIPFLLENVGGIPELNLPDGIHPTEEGHQIVFETIWPYIEEKIEA